MKTAKAVNEFIDHCWYLGLQMKSISAYEWALDKLLAAHETLPRQERPLMALITFQELSSSSKHDLWRALRRFYAFTSRMHAFPNVMEHIPPPRVRRKLPRTLEASEVDHLLSVDHGRRDRAMLAILLDTGIRNGELAAVEWPDVRMQTLNVSGKTGDRPVPISSHVRQLLLGLGDSDHLWLGRQGPLTRSGVELAVRRSLARAGFRPPKAGPHMLRHTFGRHYIMNGGDVFSLQRIMGHTSVNTTMIYVELSQADLQVQHAKFSPLRALDLDQAMPEEGVL